MDCHSQLRLFLFKNFPKTVLNYKKSKHLFFLISECKITYIPLYLSTDTPPPSTSPLIPHPSTSQLIPPLYLSSDTPLYLSTNTPAPYIFTDTPPYSTSILIPPSTSLLIPSIYLSTAGEVLIVLFKDPI